MLWSKVLVSLAEDTKKTTGWQGPMGGPQGLRESLRKAEERSDKTNENAENLTRRTLLSQNPPGLSPAVCKAPGLGTGCLCLSWKAPTDKTRASRWPGQALALWASISDSVPLRQAEGRSIEIAGNAGRLARRPLPFQNPPGLSWA